MKLLTFSFLILLIPKLLIAEESTLSNVRPRARPFSPSNLYFPNIPPKVALFSDNNAKADSYMNTNWRSFTLAERGQLILEMSKTLINAHGFRYGVKNFPYSPRIMTCKTYRESTFHPQIGADTSSAVGLTQILDGTSEDLFNRYGPIFYSKVPGFELVRDGPGIPQDQSFHHKMAASIPAQLEMGLFVLHAKAMDAKAKGVRITGVKGLLKNYLGHKNNNENREYANAIFKCAQCIERDKNDVSQGCLDCAKGLKTCTF